MRKIVINARFGGFSLSRDAFLRLRELAHPLALAEDDPFAPGFTERVIAEDKRFAEEHGREHDPANARRLADMSIQMQGMRGGKGFYLSGIPRDDPALVRVVEELGERASGGCASLKVVEVPDDVEWEIDEYDGNEHIAEKHRVWR